MEKQGMSGVHDVCRATQQDLIKINRFTRRPLSADEVYVFSLRLCDNEIDRDYEKFSLNTLEELAGMFVGKTGIFDHDAKSSNQTARIFDTCVQKEDRLTKTGEPYTCLMGRAYMILHPDNERVRLEIDAGIKKEVSVGCAMRAVRCSICGERIGEGECNHRRGEQYGDLVCYGILDGATDAYEFSFVAVPAQVNAGVVKQMKTFMGEERKMDKDFGALLSGEGSLTLTHEQKKGLAGYITRLEKTAGQGERFLSQLRKEVLCLGFSGDFGVNEKIFEGIVTKMDGDELNEMKKFLQAPGLQDLPRQLAEPAPKKDGRAGNQMFRI